MISWIQKYFQQHFRIVFAVLLVLIIISFVFTIGAAPGIGNGEHRIVERPYFDLNLASAEDQQRLMGDASVSAYLMAGAQGLSNDQIQQYALQRYASLHLANSLHIPQPSPTELTDYLKGLRIFAGQTGEFDPAAYARFRESIKGNPRMSEATLSRVLGDDYRVDRIQKLFSGPGYVMDADVRKQLTQADTQWALSTASISLDSYKPSIAIQEADLAKYFEDNAFRYEIQPRFDGSYLLFPTAKALPKVSLTEEELLAYYKANRERFKGSTKNEVAVSDEAAEFAQVRGLVEATLKQERARRLVMKEASDLTVALDDKQVKQADFASVVQASGHSLQPLTPFARNEFPKELGNVPELATEAFKLTSDRYFSDAIASPAGAIVLVYKETIPSRQPALAEVREKVAADYVENERRKRFVDLGRSLKASVEARLKSGEEFSSAIKAAAAAAGVTVETKSIPLFTLRQLPSDFNYTALNALERLEKGQLSDMSISDKAGLFVFAAEKKLPALDETNPQFAQTRTQLSQAIGATTGGSIVRELIDRELKKSEPAE